MKKHTLIVPALMAILWLLVGGIAQAEQKVYETKDASAHGLVIIENIAGSITVIGWDKNKIHVEGTLSDEVEELKFKTGKKKSIIEVVYPRHIRNIDEGADLVIKVPKDSQVEVECISATVTTSKLTGELELESISGEISFKGWCRELDASSISGDVRVEGGADDMSLESISGDIKAKGEEAKVEAESVSGSIELKYDKFLKLSTESVSGDILVVGDLAAKGRFSCDVVNGDITLVVPEDVSAEFEVSTFNGSIHNEFGQKAHRTSKYAPGRELEFSTGDGEADVELNSFNGNVSIKKK